MTLLTKGGILDHGTRAREREAVVLGALYGILGPLGMIFSAIFVINGGTMLAAAVRGMTLRHAIIVERLDTLYVLASSAKMTKNMADVHRQIGEEIFAEGQGIAECKFEIWPGPHKY